MQAFARIPFLLSAALLFAACGSSSYGPRTNAPPQVTATPQAPASRPMDPAMALGLWKSNFGPVQVAADTAKGTGYLMGVWVYDRDGREIIGSFSGQATGNVLNFSWEEPTTAAPLRGAGYLVFDPYGKSFTGRWWTDNRDRGGDWNGWRSQGDVVSSPPEPAY